jgi:hypothetical protein
MSPSRPSNAFAAALLLVLWAAPARAQQEAEEPPPRPRTSLQVVGAAGFGDGALGTTAVGGSVQGDVWGRTKPGALGLRLGGLAEGLGSRTAHGTLYGAATFTASFDAGNGLILATLAGGLADSRGEGLPGNSSLGFLLSVRGVYLVPVGSVWLGIGVDVLTVPGLGAALLASPMLDIPFF